MYWGGKSLIFNGGFGFLEVDRSDKVGIKLSIN